jgi:LSM domain
VSRAVKLNANRQVSGTMRGFDQFMNVVLDKAHDDKLDVDLGMVVRAMLALSWSWCSKTRVNAWPVVYLAGIRL